MKSFLLKTLKLLTLGIFVLFSLVWLISPYISQTVIKGKLASPELLPYDLTLGEQSHIRYNPFLSSLSIEAFSLQKKGQPVFAIEQLNIEINLYKLLINQLEVKSFNIKGLHSKVDIQGKKITIAGIEIKPDKNKKLAEDEHQKQDNDNVLLGYQFRMPKFQFVDSTITVTINNRQIQLDLTDITIKKLVADLERQSAEMTVALAIEQSKLKLESEIDLIKGQGEIEATTQLQTVNLALLEPYLPQSVESLVGQLNFNGKQTLLLNQTNSTVTLSNNELTIDQLSIEQNDIKVSSAKQSLMADEMSIVIEPNNQFNITGNAQLTLDGIAVVNSENEQLVLMKAQQLSLAKLLFTTAKNEPQLIIEQLQLKQAVISDDIANELPALTKFDLLAITNIKLAQNAIAIEKITLGNLKLDAQIADDKSLSSIEALNLPKASEKLAIESPDIVEVKTVPTTDKPESAPFQVFLGEFSLSDPANIHFLDNSVEPSYQRNFIIEQFNITDVDSSNTQQESKILLSGSSNQYAKFEFTSLNKPFAKLPFYSVKGFINELSLPAVSSYVKEALNYEIKSGQLNFAIDTELLGSDISGEANILLRGIDFTSANDHQVDSLKDQTAIPFSMALGMLKDSNGNVELNIPLAGDTSDPSFGIGGFFTLIVKQATMMAAKDYLMTTFVPYANVVNIAMTAGEFLLKVRFNDITFQNGVVDMQSHDQNFLTEFSQLMQDKPDTQITLCGVSTPADIELPIGKVIKEKSLIKQLNQLSIERAEHFKKLMVEQYKIESSRLLLCSPQIDFGKEAQPRITFAS